MNTLILYATKHGATKEIAQRIANSLGGATLHDLKLGSVPALAGFDCVIIGSSLYAGSIRKEAKAFLSKPIGDLADKKVGLFLCGMDVNGENKYFDLNFPKNILSLAKASGMMGGIYDPQKAGMFERLIMKVVTKKSAYTNTINDEKIKQFAEVMKS